MYAHTGKILALLGLAALSAGAFVVATPEAEAQQARRCSQLGAAAVVSGRVTGRPGASVEAQLYCGNQVLRTCRAQVAVAGRAATCTSAPIDLTRNNRQLRCEGAVGGPPRGRNWAVACR